MVCLQETILTSSEMLLLFSSRIIIMWAPHLFPGLLHDIKHMAAFQAVCQIGD
jgi:hypothetical protein